MSIEKKIEDLIASIDLNTAALIALSNAPIATAPTKPVAAPKPAKPVKTEAQAAAEVAARIKATEDAAMASTALSGETVGSVIESMLKANKRKEAIELLGKFGAKSASGISADQTEAFIEAANEILLAA
jgi:hypothetical protein